jgi:hypothetical protein
MRRLTLMATALAAFGLAGPASPCAFHNYAPADSLVNRLLATDHIVLARPDPANPFRYAALEAVEGPLDGVEIPFLVDSVTRRRMALNPGDTVLFIRDEGYGAWTRVAYLDAGMRPVFDSVAARLPEWELGADEDRFRMFAGLIDHPDAAVADIALREIDQADYSILRELPITAAAEPIMAGLDDPTQFDLRPIRILILGLTGDPRAESFLRASFDRALGYDGAVLGAYATALIELGGPASLDRIAREVLLDPDLPVETRELVVEAFAVQSQSGAADTGQAARAAIDMVLGQSPELAGAVARQFGMRGDFSQNERLAGLMNEKRVTAIADMLAVGQYVMFAREAN